jgi:hypothetical protein
MLHGYAILFQAQRGQQILHRRLGSQLRKFPRLAVDD